MKEYEVVASVDNLYCLVEWFSESYVDDLILSNKWDEGVVLKDTETGEYLYMDEISYDNYLESLEISKEKWYRFLNRDTKEKGKCCESVLLDMINKGDNLIFTEIQLYKADIISALFT